MKNTPIKPNKEHLTLTYGETWYSVAEIDMLAFRNNRIDIDEVRKESDYNLIRRAAVTILEAQAQSYTYRTPTTWWQMFKRDHFPPWALKKWPVQKNVETVIIKDLFPFPEEKYPGNLGDHIRIARIERIPFSFTMEDEA